MDNEKAKPIHCTFCENKNAVPGTWDVYGQHLCSECAGKVANIILYRELRLKK